MNPSLEPTERTPARVVGADQRHPDLDSLYCVNPDGSRNKIHTADVRGRYQRRKVLLWLVMIAVYVSLPWLEIGGRPAILIDIVNRHFYLFGNTFNAQDFWLAFFVLTGIGFTLIVVSALWGRIWCGYGCPQTVFLEGVFRRVERFFEGSASRRRKLDQMGLSLEKVARRTAKYVVYAALALALSHTFLGYFMPVREIVQAITSPPSEHPTAFAFVTIFTVIIYLNFAWFREQLCIVVCPYGRLQAVLYDKDTVNVGYDKKRGEPRGRHNASGRGDCIDCYRCVAVCPTGIDIRNGTQLECVGCANCIDACDDVMDRLGQARGLVRYDSQRGFEENARRFWRARVILYAILLALGTGVFAFAVTRRTLFEANLARVAGSPYTLEGDVVTNVFTLHLVNKMPTPASFTIDPAADERLQWTIPVRASTLATLEDQRLPLLVKFARGAFPGGGETELSVSCEAGRRIVKVRLVAP